jgi:hypothetical protein
MPDSRSKYRDDYDIVVTWQTKVAEAAVPFEARWTEAALRRTDPELYARFRRQRELFNTAVQGGSRDEVIAHSGGMVRAYVAVSARMEASGAVDDAYQIGRGRSGMTIAIGPRPCCDRVKELYGDAVQWFTPDEIAAIIEMDARFKALAEVKRVFPGAEINQVNEWASVAGG